MHSREAYQLVDINSGDGKVTLTAIRHLDPNSFSTFLPEIFDPLKIALLAVFTMAKSCFVGFRSSSRSRMSDAFPSPRMSPFPMWQRGQGNRPMFLIVAM